MLVKHCNSFAQSINQSINNILMCLPNYKNMCKYFNTFAKLQDHQQFFRCICQVTNSSANILMHLQKYQNNRKHTNAKSLDDQQITKLQDHQQIFICICKITRSSESTSSHLPNYLVNDYTAKPI